MKTVVTEPSTVRIGRCADCCYPLPLRTARADEVAATWECCVCQARYRGVIAEDSACSERRNVRRICRR